jgi:hypothetical protein
MVFPYMDHDLTGILENHLIKLSPAQIKSYILQILQGLEYMHSVHLLSKKFILHRKDIFIEISKDLIFSSIMKALLKLPILV